MTIDWNWFFAAFAQCAAALIAIIGAFIISKLLGEAEKEEVHSSKIDQLVIQYNGLLKRISVRYFDWYDKRNIDYSSALEKSIKSGDFQGLNDEEKLIKLFEIEPDLFGTPSCLEELDKKIVELTPNTTQLGNRFSIVNSPMSLNIPPVGLWDKLSKEREAINQLKIESETLIERFDKARNDISITQNNLTPIKITIYILGIGLLLTIIYPLHFMPIGVNQSPTLGFSFDLIISNIFSIKGLLLFLLTIVIEGIFGYFLWLIKSLEKKYATTTSRLDEKYFNILSYSQYF
ncbi:MAG: hypothetical protein KUL78_02570 [Flavobacterium sp.]|nr:hypothetical protein [Flavobacterium sp.]